MDKPPIMLPWLVHALRPPTEHQGFVNTYCGKPRETLDLTREQGLRPRPLLPGGSYVAAALPFIGDWADVNCVACRSVVRQLAAQTHGYPPDSPI